MSRKQELIKYLNAKYEALDFWKELREVMPLENKIALLQEEIKVAYAELQEIRLNEKVKDGVQNESQNSKEDLKQAG